MKTALVWFKNDLRLHDNETLLRAMQENDRIVPVYCFDDDHFKTTKLGLQKTGVFRAQFLLESLLCLDRNLRERGSGLIVVEGKPSEQLSMLAREFTAQQVYAMEEVAIEELRTQQLVEAALQEIDCKFTTCNTATLYEEHELPFSPAQLPDVFTVFRKRVESESAVRQSRIAPEIISSPEIGPIKLPKLNELGLAHDTIDDRAAIKFQGGENAGLERLHYYLFGTGAVSTYKLTRNGMCGSDYSSKFSAWLSLGCLSAREIVAQLKTYEAERGSNESTYWLFFELLWRDYFRWMMRKYGNRLFLLNGLKNTTQQTGKHNAARFEQWKNGKTGNDFVDANMQELKRTGFMSNRGRQNVASYLCNDLQLDWRYGAAYFEQQLIDYDVCSNWGNWAYVAGVGNDPRGKRIFNIEKQAADYDSDRRFRNLWLS